MEQRALIRCGKVAVAEAVDTTGWNHAATEDDEAGQIAALGAKSICGPGTHARPALQARPAMEEVDCVRALGEVGEHSSDESEAIHAVRTIGEQTVPR